MAFVPVLQQLLGYEGIETEPLDDEEQTAMKRNMPTRKSANPSLSNKGYKKRRRKKKKNSRGNMSFLTTTAEKAKSRFQFAFAQFLQIISKYYAPLVMILDDLQWACSSTLELLELLISDRRTESVLVVGIYRSNEVPQTHLLYKFIHETIQQRQQEGLLELTNIKIGNLDIDAIQEMIQDLQGNLLDGIFWALCGSG